MRQRGLLVAGTAKIEWMGDPSITSPAVCSTNLVDETGQTVWRGTARVEPLWPLPTERDYEYPYRKDVTIVVRDPAIAHTSDELLATESACMSL